MSNPNAPTVARTTAPAELSAPGLVLLYGSTPNGWKCTYALEILKQAGLVPGYTVCEVYLQNGEQFQPWFKEVNPNCAFHLSLSSLLPLAAPESDSDTAKMPALIDNRPNKKPAYVWESASILRYLERTYDTQKVLGFEDPDLQTEMDNWIFWTQGGLGPMQASSRASSPRSSPAD